MEGGKFENTVQACYTCKKEITFIIKYGEDNDYERTI